MGSGRGRSVLLVDDDADLRYVTNLALSRVGGFDVVGVGSVAAARESLARRVPDVILLDVELPDQDGPSFALELGRSDTLAAVRVQSCSVAGTLGALAWLKYTRTPAGALTSTSNMCCGRRSATNVFVAAPSPMFVYVSG